MPDPLGRKGLHELIAELCPDGVEFKKLGEVGEFIRGGGLTKKELTDHGKPAIHYGQLYTRYGFAASETLSCVNPELHNKLRKASQGNLVIASTSENTDDLCKALVWEGGADVAISGDAHIYKHSLAPRYAGYLFQSSEFLFYKRTHATGVKVKRLNSKEMSDFEVPVPPLPIQEAIVAYLDKFSELEAELEAELVRRQKQYEWYRMHLLDFKRQAMDKEGKPTGVVLDYQYGDEYKARPAVEGVRGMMEELCPDGVEHKKMSTVAQVKTGSKNAQDAVENGVYPFYIRSRSIKCIDSFTHDTTAILVPGEGGVGKIFHYAEGKFSVHQRVYCIDQFSTEVLPRFTYFYMQQAFGNYVARKSIRGTVESLRLPMFKDFEIPAPPLPVQEAIVKMLDEFDTLVNDMSTGIPAEIAARRKQYEYYREQLLSFNQQAVVDSVNE